MASGSSKPDPGGRPAPGEGTQLLPGPSGGGGQRRLFACSATLFLGPGLLVSLADTDGGCLVVAAESGARYGYSLVLLMVVLTPVLFVAQELTVRLGTHTHMGHMACIRLYYGRGLAIAAVIPLLLTAVGTELSELSVLAAVGELWGLSRWASVATSVALLLGVVFAGSYRIVETVAIFFGLFELVFLVTMIASRPDPREVSLLAHPSQRPVPTPSRYSSGGGGHGDPTPLGCFPQARRSEHRRRHHAVDDLLPAVGRRCEEDHTRPRGGARAHEHADRIDPHTAHHDRGDDHGCRHTRGHRVDEAREHR